MKIELRRGRPFRYVFVNSGGMDKLRWANAIEKDADIDRLEATLKRPGFAHQRSGVLYRIG
jgi:hypothetical protein